MKVLLAHTPYEQKGGEDIHVAQLALQYQQLGIDILWLPQNRSAPHLKPRQALASLGKNSDLFSSLRRGRDFDFVHLHNAFPALGIPFFHWLKENKIPSLMTVHNHRFYCTNGLALRDGKICKLCIDSPRPWRALVHNCNSDWQKSAYHTFAISQLRSQNLLQEAISLFLAPSPYVAAELSRWGADSKKIHTLIHPIAPQEENIAAAPAITCDVFYAGRLSAEKGLEQIIECASFAPDLQFGVAGNGPMLAQMQYRKRKLRNLKFFPDLERSQMLAHLAQAKIALAPSLCNETLSLFALEAMCMGKRVVVSDLDSTRWLASSPFFATLAPAGDAPHILAAIRNTLALPSPEKSAVDQIQQALAGRRFQKELGQIIHSLLEINERK